MRGKLLVIAAVAALALQSSAAQQVGSANAGGKGARAGAVGAKPKPGTEADANSASNADVTKILKDAEDAMGMIRSIARVDAINTMEFWASGTSYVSGQPFKTEYHSNLGYNPPGMRVEITRATAGGSGTPITTIEVVNEKYAWDESEIGAGLIPGKGTATPAMQVFKKRYLQLWMLPYGALKAATDAGDKAKVTSEKGATVITFPLSGQLAGITVRLTLDEKEMVSSVETQSNDPALRDVLVNVKYSDYQDRSEAASDLQFPGQIVETEGGHPLLDLKVSKDDPYNPYEIFRTPKNVMQTDSAH